MPLANIKVHLNTVQSKTMKKLILSAFALSLVAVTTVNAQASTATAAATVQDSKTPVKIEDLPEAVKNTLKADEYKESIPTSANLVKENGNEYYAIELKKGTETTTLKLDKEGKLVQ